MVNQTAVSIVGLAVILLIAAFAIPLVISESNGTQTDRQVIQEGQSFDPTVGLTVAVESTTENESQINVIDEKTGTVDNMTLSAGETQNYSLPGGSGNVTLVDSTANYSTVDVVYPPTYGYEGGAKVFSENIGFLLIVTVTVVVVAGIAKVVG